MQIQLKERPVMDLNSGIIETYEVVKKSLDEQLHQTYLVDFFRILGLNGKQLKIALYIAENTDKWTNIFTGTYTSIENSIDVSRPTIAATLKKLQKYQLIEKIKNGYWRVNANMLPNNDTKRSLLVSYYQDDEEQAPNYRSFL